MLALRLRPAKLLFLFNEDEAVGVATLDTEPGKAVVGVVGVEVAARGMMLEIQVSLYTAI
jgi:hypothetical protein